ncbi:ice-binding family protein [Polynucleobacter arcticus]|uniref:DUF3494 domain-containing protein n=1 Tax=Polynucleobacter arcticus TaxID=1743165 RepID=A0A6M9PIB6_9BURK|nr:ice-binding family protein [Polynucleobacter arcticus]QKM60169.1 hypothetical protein DN92_03430 [Polynucleobacter arcticus]
MKAKNYYWGCISTALTLLVSVSLVGCSGGGGDSASGGGSTAGSASSIAAFSINGQTGTVNQATNSIAVTVPNGTPLNSLIATFTATGSVVKVGGTTQVSGVTSNNFTTPVAYVVTAANGATTTYQVTVTAASMTAKAITNYSLNGVVGTINSVAKTINVVMPTGTSLNALTATFTATGSGITIASTPQVSGVTSNNFTNPVSYLVTAADSSTETYSVTVIVAAATSKALTSYSLNGVSGTINQATQNIVVAMPSGTAVNALIASFNTTGSSVSISGVTQASGATINNFTNPVAYVVTAADLSTASYTVTVTVAGAGPAPVALGNVGSFVLFADSGMSSSPDSAITGDVGVGPSVTSTAITTGFTLTLPAGGAFATAPQVTGNVYAVDYADPTPVFIVSASNDMLTAYNDAAGRPNPIILASSDLSGLTLAPGLYSSPVSLNLLANTTLTLNGGPNDVWIIQVAGGVTTGAVSQVLLTGGAVSRNVFWQIQTSLSVGASSSFSGVVLTGTTAIIGANSTVNGRLLSQTAITMDADTITQPAQ